ncbi:MAG: hypothetical protein ACRCT7_00120 [Shewanella sp.]
MNHLAKLLYLAIFGLLVFWGVMPQNSGFSPFALMVYQYAQGLSPIEHQLLSYLIIPSFIVALGWYSWSVWSLLGERLVNRPSHSS